MKARAQPLGNHISLPVESLNDYFVTVLAYSLESRDYIWVTFFVWLDFSFFLICLF